MAVRRFAYAALGVGIVATGFSFGGATPADAACFGGRVTGNIATGRVRFLVERRARLNWADAVRDVDGRRFSNWNYARDRSMSCRREHPSDPWECRARGRPCDRSS
jgi:hypothetical protein